MVSQFQIFPIAPITENKNVHNSREIHCDTILLTFAEQTKNEVLVQSMFSAWKEEAIGDGRASKQLKADCFNKFVLTHAHFRMWRNAVR